MKLLKNKLMGGCVHCKYLLLGWTIAILISLAWNLYLLHSQMVEQARIEARTIFAHNMAYRRWNTMHGGVYVKLDEQTEPNPYLVTDDRDLTTDNGIQLTMINPFQMTREAYQLLQEDTSSPVYNRTVSTGFLNPANEPDDWEEKALSAFYLGNDEVSEIISMKGKPYMRLIRPYITYEGCLKCHGFQGYDVGDIRGGMSISVPMKPYFAQETVARRATVFTHFALWLFGLGSITLLTRNIERHQRKVSESEKKFRVLAESATDWEYWVSDKEGIIFMSPSCVEITGYSREEFQANQDLITEIIHKEDMDKYLKHSFANGNEIAKAIEIRIKAKDGNIKWLSHAWRSIYIDGVIMGRRVSNRDITTRKVLENQLYHAQRMDAIGGLTGGIAHDFNNILTAILGYSLLSLRQLPEQSPLKKNIEAIFQAGEKAAGLTKQLLAFSRKQVLKMEPVELGSVIDGMKGMIRRLISEEIDLKIEMEPGSTVLADQSQLDQVVLNLAVNARDAMPEGGILSIRVKKIHLDISDKSIYRGAKPGEYILLTVSDTGEGMKKEVQDKIFEPFFTTKESGKGTGLGLATVYGIVKQHNGFIYVDSELGSGTMFSVLIPAILEKAAQEKTEEDDSLFAGTETIMVVDDETTVCDLVAHSLEPFGYTVYKAPCASEAIKYAMSCDKAIDLLLTDVVMPGMNGRELAESLTGISTATKVIYMSGHTNNVITRQGRLEDGINFICKPFTPNELAKEIRRVLDS